MGAAASVPDELALQMSDFDAAMALAASVSGAGSAAAVSASGGASAVVAAGAAAAAAATAAGVLAAREDVSLGLEEALASFLEEIDEVDGGGLLSGPVSAAQSRTRRRRRLGISNRGAPTKIPDEVLEEKHNFATKSRGQLNELADKSNPVAARRSRNIPNLYNLVAWHHILEASGEIGPSAAAELASTLREERWNRILDVVTPATMQRSFVASDKMEGPEFLSRNGIPDVGNFKTKLKDLVDGQTSTNGDIHWGRVAKELGVNILASEVREFYFDSQLHRIQKPTVTIEELSDGDSDQE